LSNKIIGKRKVFPIFLRADSFFKEIFTGDKVQVFMEKGSDWGADVNPALDYP
jgi:hypothetical protein